MNDGGGTWPAGAFLLITDAAIPGATTTFVVAANDTVGAVRAIEATGARTAVLRHRRDGDPVATLEGLGTLMAAAPQVGYVVVHAYDGRDLQGVLAAVATPPGLPAALPAGPIAGRAARAVVRRVAGARVPVAVLADLELVASELASNAVLHGRPPYRLSVWRGDDRLHLEVADGGEGRPRPRRAGDGEGGRGLVLVDRLSICWGVTPRGNGKVVWADVPLS